MEGVSSVGEVSRYRNGGVYILQFLWNDTFTAVMTGAHLLPEH